MKPMHALLSIVGILGLSTGMASAQACEGHPVSTKEYLTGLGEVKHLPRELVGALWDNHATAEAQLTYQLLLFHADLLNGGFGQVMFNQRKAAPAAAKAYEAIGLPDDAELVERAIVLHDADAPEHPTDREQARQAYAQFQEAQSGHWRELSDRYVAIAYRRLEGGDYVDVVATAAGRYMGEHAEAFEAVVEESLRRCR